MIHDATFKLIEPLAVILRLQPEALDEIDAYARRHGLALAEAVTCLIRAGLDAESAAMLHYERARADLFAR